MTWLHLILVSTLVALATAGCPTGTVYNSNSKMCYKYVKDTLRFVDAEQSCIDQNGHLSSIQNAFINMEVQSQANTFFSCASVSEYWLGGNTVFTPTWGWTDDSAWSYTNWASGQGGPYPSPQCVSAAISDGRWYNSSCDVAKAYVCAIPEATPTCPTIPTQVPVIQQTCPPQVPTTSCPNSAAPVARCEDEWMHFNETGYCYTIVHNLDYWSAENKCISMGAHLTSIHSLIENNFLQKIAMTGDTPTSGSSRAWIGLNLLKGEWVWTDGTPFDYQLWYYNQPEAGYSCAKFVPDDSTSAIVGKWMAETCTLNMRAAVCKKEATW